ncbi:rhomboid family intramembrane serine protease [Rapidithrix thailandica]|uniref:Rhomboid family intramembrane serine protease n=1 Tax=Rapidithrix thailandica TaxID=413964 RepID=A0AAW9S5D4_9BACT
MEINYSFNLVLIIIIVAISLYTGNRPALLQKLMMNPYRIVHNKEYYRMLSSGFIHGGMAHLFFNCFTLYFFGSLMERIFNQLFGPLGTLYYLLLFILGVVISDIPTLVKHKNNFHYNSLGASGGVSAVVFASIIFNPLGEIYLFLIPFGIPGFILGLVYLIYSYYQSKNSSDHINHDAHFFGALFGVAYSVILYPSVIPHFFRELSRWTFF